VVFGASVNICNLNLLHWLQYDNEPFAMHQIKLLVVPGSQPLTIFGFCWRILLQLGFAVCVSSLCFSQNAGRNDSLEYQSQLARFDEAIGIENTGIVNGTKYTVPFQISGSHPFYISASGAKGDMTFVEQPYFNLILLYDVYSDELITQQLRPNGVHALIKLYKPNVALFRIHDHTFRNYHGDKAKKLGIASGFYDVLYENSTFTLIAKRKKNTHVQTAGRIQYESEDQYFFIQKERVTPFRGMKNFYQVLGDKDLISELRSFVSKNNLKTRKSDRDLIVVARQCDTILNKRK
jgi:hypothetical protein